MAMLSTKKFPLSKTDLELKTPNKMSVKNDVENPSTKQNDERELQLNMNFNIWNPFEKKKPTSREKITFLEKYKKYWSAIMMMIVIISLITLIGQIYFLKQDLYTLKSQLESFKLKPQATESQPDRSRLRRIARYDFLKSTNSSIREFSKLMKEEDFQSESIKDNRVLTDIFTLTTDIFDQEISTVSELPMDNDNNTFEKNNISTITNDATMSSTLFEDTLVISPEEQNIHCNMTCEMQNRTARDATIDGGDGNDLSLRKESRTRRLRRDMGRGKKWRKNRRGPKRSCRRLAPLIATFIGAIPEQHITNSALIGPWIKDNQYDSRYNFTKFHLVEKNMAIEVTTSGLYLISVQIYYFGDSMKHSYWILLNSEGSSKARKLATCSTATSNISTEVSCHTNVIMHMQKNDRLRIEQQEQNRLINLQEGYSHIQLVLLANDAQGNF